MTDDDLTERELRMQLVTELDLRTQLAEERRQLAELRERTANLERLDGLLHTLTGVLDVREVFDRVSTIAQRVLPHDALSIADSIDEGRNVRVHASHGLGHLKQPYDYPTPDPSMVAQGLIAAEHLALTPMPALAPTPVQPVASPTVNRALSAPAPSWSPVEPTGDLNAMERTMIEQALQQTRFNKSKAAQALGLSRHQLYIKLRKHGLD